MSTSSRRARHLLLAFALVLPLESAAAGGIEVPPSGATPAREPRDESDLRQRARQYWEARIAGSQRVFEFYAPPEKGGPRGPAEVSEGGNLRFTAFVIEGVDVRADEALVRVRVQATVPAGRQPPRSVAPRRALIREAWERVDGAWYKRPIPRGFGRGHSSDGRKP